MRSWFLWNALYPKVRALTRNEDVDGLLRIIDTPPSAEEQEQFSERALAACALGRFPSDAVAGALAPLLAPEESDWVRVCAADALRRIGTPAASAAIRPALNDAHWGVQNDAAKALRHTPDPAAAPLLAALLAGESVAPLVRSNAAEALGATASDDWIPILTETAKDRHFIVALGGLGGLRFTDSEAALDALRALTREGKLLRRASAWLLYTKLKRVLRRRESAAAR